MYRTGVWFVILVHSHCKECNKGSRFVVDSLRNPLVLRRYEPRSALGKFDVVVRQNTLNGLCNPSDVRDNCEFKDCDRPQCLSFSRASKVNEREYVLNPGCSMF